MTPLDALETRSLALLSAYRELLRDLRELNGECDG